MKRKKKLLALLMSLCMVITLTPGLAWAEGEASSLPSADEDVNINFYLDEEDTESWKTVKITPGSTINTKYNDYREFRPEDTSDRTLYSWGRVKNGKPWEAIDWYRVAFQEDTNLYGIWLPLVTEVEIQKTGNFISPAEGEPIPEDLSGQVLIPEEAYYTLDPKYTGWCLRDEETSAILYFEKVSGAFEAGQTYYLILRIVINKIAADDGKSYSIASFPLRSNSTGLILSENKVYFAGTVDSSQVIIHFDGNDYSPYTGGSGSIIVAIPYEVSKKPPTPAAKPKYAVTAEPSDAGTIIFSKEKSRKGEEVTFEVELKEGAGSQEVVVTDKDGNEIPVTKNEDGTYSFIMPAGPVRVALKPAEGSGYRDCPKDETCPATAFKDLDVKDWYHDGVHWTLDRGIMNGLTVDQFAPGETTTRAMIVTMLWRMEGEPDAGDGKNFDDVEVGSWYEQAVNWAAAKKIVSGYNEKTFGPADPMTREQLAAILFRYSGEEDIGGAMGLAGFVDEDQISGWARDAMLWAVAKGMINGTTETTLSPQGNATRAQVATILMRCSE